MVRCDVGLNCGVVQVSTVDTNTLCQNAGQQVDHAESEELSEAVPSDSRQSCYWARAQGEMVVESKLDASDFDAT